MTTRTKLLLSALACILCIVIVLSTDTSHRPFERLASEDITSFDIETAVGVKATISDQTEIDELAALLNSLTIYHNVDADGTELASYSILVQNGKSYELVIFDGFIRLDGVTCSANTIDTDALYEFAKRFA